MALKSVQRWTSAAARRVIDAAGGKVTVEVAVTRVVQDLRAGTSGPPTDLHAIAERLGVHRIEPDVLAGTGELRRDGDQLTIVYSSGLPRGRRRFTIAHELGHAFYERTGPNGPRHGEELERICDLFAVELLMPGDLAGEVLEPATPSALFDMSKRFEVSLTAAMYRLVELKAIHAALDDGERRTATLPALASFDPAVDRLVTEARTSGHARDLMRLARNSVWNGNWSLDAAADGGGRLVVITAAPADGEGVPLRSRC